MNVRDLVKKLNAIEDGTTETLFFCENCGHYVPVADMKGFGFIRNERLEPSPLMKRLAEIMTKKPEPDWSSKDWKMRPIQQHPIRHNADAFAAALNEELPQDARELQALLWTFGEILSGDMEKRLNAWIKIADDLQNTLPAKLILDPLDGSQA